MKGRILEMKMIFMGVLDAVIVETVAVIISASRVVLVRINLAVMV